MHRSGTSALCELLSGCGASLVEDLLPTIDAVNKHGFFEDAKIVEINERILEGLERQWYDISLLAENWQENIDLSIINDARSHVRQYYLANPLSILKDPRLSLLMPFWIPIFADLGIDLKVVVSHRHPSQVASSLENRDGIPFDSGVLLWLNYTIAALESLSLVDRFSVVDYDELLSDPAKTVVKISDDLAIPTLTYGAEANSAIDVSERRFDQTDLDLRWIQSLGTIINQVSDYLINPAQNKIDQISKSWFEWNSEHGEWVGILNTHLKKLVLTNRQLHDLGEMYSHAQHIVKQRDKKIAVLERSVFLRIARKLIYRGNS